jgi:hypothetical protein
MPRPGIGSHLQMWCFRPRVAQVVVGAVKFLELIELDERLQKEMNDSFPFTQPDDRILCLSVNLSHHSDLETFF